jgi:microcin C transport system substrate-binding protein
MSGELINAPLKSQPLVTSRLAKSRKTPQFQDRRVRRAIGLAMDFEWDEPSAALRHLSKRVNGYFPNSELQATGSKPDEA